MNNDKIEELHRQIESVSRVLGLHAIALNSVLYAISQQPSIDPAKLTEDVNQSLLADDASQDKKAAMGIPVNTEMDYLKIRAILRVALPNLPLR